MLEPQKLLATISIPLIMLAGCLVRRRVISTQGPLPNRPPLTLSKEDLVRRIHDIADPLQSFLMRVDMAPSAGSQYTGVITDYATLGGHILYHRPDEIRVLGQDPLMSTTIFDMVSIGPEFRMSIPNKNRFIIGDNTAPPTSKNELENMRPAAFLTALLIAPPDPDTDITILEDDTGGGRAACVLLIIRQEHDQYRIVRNVYFDPYTLQITEQRTFDSLGHIAGDTSYANWRNYDRVPYPSVIDIKRPQENYEIQLNVIGMTMNPANITPDKFTLEQPPGSRLFQLK